MRRDISYPWFDEYEVGGGGGDDNDDDETGCRYTVRIGGCCLSLCRLWISGVA